MSRSAAAMLFYYGSIRQALNGSHLLKSYLIYGPASFDKTRLGQLINLLNEMTRLQDTLKLQIRFAELGLGSILGRAFL